MLFLTTFTEIASGTPFLFGKLPPGAVDNFQSSGIKVIGYPLGVKSANFTCNADHVF
jgi:hypothetical protein